MGKNIYYWT